MHAAQLAGGATLLAYMADDDAVDETETRVNVDAGRPLATFGPVFWF